MSESSNRRRTFVALALALGAAVCVAAIVVALSEDGTAESAAGNPDSALTPTAATSVPDDLPRELAALREDANQVIEDPGAFDRRLRSLEGHPVIVNAWASWCGPCRFEFPFFQTQAIEHENEIAFVGLDVDDSPDAARTFLEELPLPYPSYADPDYQLMRRFDLGQYLPSTVFIDEQGEVAYAKLGPYTSEEDLAADIERYAQ